MKNSISVSGYSASDLDQYESKMAQSTVNAGTRNSRNSRGVSPLFSVITVCWNNEKTLERAIHSVAAQSFQDYEYLVVDGGSRDGTLAIIQKNAAAIDRWVTERDAGISDALNKGIALARGEWIVFLHSDDWLEPDALASFHKLMSKDPSAEILSQAIRYRTQEGEVYRTSGPEPEKIWEGMSLPHTGMATKKDVFRRIGLFHPWFQVALDYELILRAKKNQIRFAFASIPVTNMQMGGTSDRRLLRGRWENLSAQTKHFGWKMKFISKFLKDSTRVILREVYHRARHSLAK